MFAKLFKMVACGIKELVLVNICSSIICYSRALVRKEEFHDSKSLFEEMSLARRRLMDYSVFLGQAVMNTI